MKYYYIAKCKQCGKTYQIDTAKDNFATFQLAEERNATVKALSFIHNCEGHVFGVAEITGISFEDTVVQQTPIKIGSDGLCTCKQSDKCPLYKTGMMSRCTKEELIKAGIPIISESTRPGISSEIKIGKIAQSLLPEKPKDNVKEEKK